MKKLKFKQESIMNLKYLPLVFKGQSIAAMAFALSFFLEA